MESPRAVKAEPGAAPAPRKDGAISDDTKAALKAALLKSAMRNRGKDPPCSVPDAPEARPRPVTAAERQREREEKRRRRQERAKERERRQRERERREPRGGGRAEGLQGLLLSDDDRHLLERWTRMRDGAAAPRQTRPPEQPPGPPPGPAPTAPSEPWTCPEPWPEPPPAATDSDVATVTQQLSRSQVEDPLPPVFPVTPKGSGAGYGLGFDLEEFLSQSLDMVGEPRDSQGDSAPLSASLLADWLEVHRLSPSALESLQRDLQLGSPMVLSGDQLDP